MKRSMMIGGVLVVVSLSLVGYAQQPRRGQTQPAAPAAEKAANREADRAAVAATRTAFFQAVEKGDLKTVLASWTAEGEYIGDEGTNLRGREALEKAYGEYLKKNPLLAIEAEVDELRFPSRDSAIELGHLSVRKGKDGERSLNRYSILYVREDGKWHIAVLREWAAESASLEELDWLVGTWTAKREGADIRVTYEWEPGKKFLRARFTIKDKDTTSTGLQMIGVDPTSGETRVWTFDNGGGFGEATMAREGKNRWIQESRGTTADGGTSTASNILSRLDDNSFTWQSVSRTLNDEEQEDLPPIKVTRVRNK